MLQTESAVTIVIIVLMLIAIQYIFRVFTTFKNYNIKTYMQVTKSLNGDNNINLSYAFSELPVLLCLYRTQPHGS